MDELLLVLDDGQTFSALAGCRLVRVRHDAERDGPLDRTLRDGLKVDGVLWENAEAGLTGEVLLAFPV